MAPSRTCNNSFVIIIVRWHNAIAFAAGDALLMASKITAEGDHIVVRTAYIHNAMREVEMDPIAPVKVSRWKQSSDWVVSVRAKVVYRF